MFGKEAWYLVEDGQYFCPIGGIGFPDIGTVQGENVPFPGVGRLKAQIVIQICRYALRHAPDNHVLLEEQHGLPMDGLFKRLLLGETFLDICRKGLFATRPKEFLEIHGVHGDGVFLRGNENIRYVFLDADKRTRFDDVVTTVLHQRLDRLPRTGESLDFIKK